MASEVRPSTGLGLCWPSQADAARRVLVKARNEKLPRGIVAAINAARWRVPPGTPEAAAALADRALETIADVLDGKITGHAAQSALAAARMIREEVCGAPTRNVKVEGTVGLAALLGAAGVGSAEAEASQALLEPAGEAIEGEVVPDDVPEEIPTSPDDSDSGGSDAD